VVFLFGVNHNNSRLHRNTSNQHAFSHAANKCQKPEVAALLSG